MTLRTRSSRDLALQPDETGVTLRTVHRQAIPLTRRGGFFCFFQIRVLRNRHVNCPVGKTDLRRNDPLHYETLALPRHYKKSVQCEKVFPAESLKWLPAGKVLDLTVRTEGLIVHRSVDFSLVISKSGP